MRRAPTRDWQTTPWLYGGLHRFAPELLQALARMRVRGREHLARLGDRGAVLAANHASAFDPVLIAACVPRQVSWLGKREVFSNRATTWFFRSVGAIPVDRARKGNEEAMREALAALEAGRLVGVFPQGTRTPIGEAKEPRPGVARLALGAGVPVVPMGILVERWLPKHAVVPRLGEACYLAIGEPLDYGHRPEASPDEHAKVARDVMARIETLVADAAAAREREERWPRARYRPEELR